MHYHLQRHQHIVCVCVCVCAVCVYYMYPSLTACSPACPPVSFFTPAPPSFSLPFSLFLCFTLPHIFSLTPSLSLPFSLLPLPPILPLSLPPSPSHFLALRLSASPASACCRSALLVDLHPPTHPTQHPHTPLSSPSLPLATLHPVDQCAAMTAVWSRRVERAAFAVTVRSRRSHVMGMTHVVTVCPRCGHVSFTVRSRCGYEPVTVRSQRGHEPVTARSSTIPLRARWGRSPQMLLCYFYEK